MKPKVIVTTYEKLNSLLGITVPEDEVDAILTRLGFAVHRDKTVKGQIVVGVPLWRDDIDGFADLAEEVIRSYGYDHITPTFLEKASVTHGGLTQAQQQELKFKNVLREQGFFEACNYSFYSPKDFDLLRLPPEAPERKAIAVLNPIGEDLSLMRTILLPSMIANVVRNVRRGNDAGRLFELANVYLAEELPLTALPEERKKCVLAQWSEGDFFDLKGAVEALAEAFSFKLTFARPEESKPFLHSGISADIKMGEKTVGFLGELHPAIASELALEKKVYVCEIDYDALKRKFASEISYHNLPKFPAVSRDLAIVVEEKVTCADVQTCILRACKAVKRAELFDVYRSEKLGKDKKSMAFSLTFVPEENAEKALTPEAVEKMFQKIVGSLTHTLGAELR